MTKYLLLTLLLVLLLCLSSCELTVNTGALDDMYEDEDLLDDDALPDDDDRKYDSDYDDYDGDGAIDWELSDDGKILYRGIREYYFYAFPESTLFSPANIYAFTNTVSAEPYGQEGEVGVYAPSKDSEFAWVEVGEYVYFYATLRGRQSLDLFYSNQTSDGNIYIKNRNDRYASVTADTHAAFKTDFLDPEMHFYAYMSDLSGCPYYAIYEFDSTETFAKRLGFVFEYEGAFCYVPEKYVPYEVLEDGNLTFVRGQLLLSTLSPESDALMIEAIGRLAPIYATYDYEYDDDYDDDSYSDDEMPIGLFWFCYVLVAFFAPIPFIVIGLVFPHIRKFGKPKYWYIMAGLGGIWFTLAMLLMILLLL